MHEKEAATIPSINVLPNSEMNWREMPRTSTGGTLGVLGDPARNWSKGSWSLSINTIRMFFHVFKAVQFPENYEKRYHSSLQVFGDAAASAMAKNVGYTTAAAAKLIIDGLLEGKRGLLLPTDPALYGPILKKVEQEGISFTEEVLANRSSARVE